MIIEKKTVLRMRDVGFALSACSHFAAPLNRVGLQKFLYLTDALSRLFEVLPPAEGHETYKHGPYDRFIQNAVDCLCFRRIARISKSSVSGQGNVSTEYELTDDGKIWARKLATTEIMRQRWMVSFSVASEIDSGHNWHRLRELVYAEPTFVNAKARGWRQTLNLAEGRSATSFALVKMMQLALSSGFSEAEPSLNLLVSLYFKYLSRYSSAQKVT